MAFLHTQRSAVSSLRDRIAVLLEYLVDVETGTHACAQTSSLASRNNVALTPLSRARAHARTRLLLPPPSLPFRLSLSHSLLFGAGIAGVVTGDPELLRSINAICHRLPLLNTPALHEETLTQETDALLLTYLSTLTRAQDQFSEVPGALPRLPRAVASRRAADPIADAGHLASASASDVAHGQVFGHAGPPRPPWGAPALLTVRACAARARFCPPVYCTAGLCDGRPCHEHCARCLPYCRAASAGVRATMLSACSPCLNSSLSSPYTSRWRWIGV